MKLPDFILIGAQKSGTSSLHHILNAHEDVFLPPGEIFFFDVDDEVEHPDFFINRRGERIEHDWDADHDRYLQWYTSCFERGKDARWVGEDSTTYLSSARAPARIKSMLPDVRLIAMLRDPVARAHSHYWHTVSTGRATHTLEETLDTKPGNLLRRGHYQSQLARYLSVFDRDALLVVFFEDFVRDPQSIVDRVCAHIGCSTIDTSTVSTHKNSASPPWNLSARLLWNRMAPGVARKRYDRRIPGMSVSPRCAQPPPRAQLPDALARPLDWIETRLPKRRYPALRAETRARLERHFREENAELSDLLEEDVAKRWPWMRLTT